MSIICFCDRCKSRVDMYLSETDHASTPETGPWYEYTCSSCGDNGFVCKRDYVRWLAVYKRRMASRAS